MKIVEYKTKKSTHKAYILNDGVVVVISNDSDKDFLKVIENSLSVSNIATEVSVPQYFVFDDDDSEISHSQIGSIRIPNKGDFMVKFHAEIKTRFNNTVVVYGNVTSTIEPNEFHFMGYRKPLKVENVK